MADIDTVNTDVAAIAAAFTAYQTKVTALVQNAIDQIAAVQAANGTVNLKGAIAALETLTSSINAAAASLPDIGVDPGPQPVVVPPVVPPVVAPTDPAPVAAVPAA